MCDDELFYAARTGDAARVAFLVEAGGASVDARDDFQATPLFHASLCGHTDVVRILLRAGAKCEVRRGCDERACVGRLTCLCDSGARTTASAVSTRR
jgi:ankyrin repeat/BTB/POZ domain-containing protein 1